MIQAGALPSQKPQIKLYWWTRVLLPAFVLSAALVLVVFGVFVARTRSLQEDTLAAAVATISSFVIDPLQTGDHLEVLKRIGAAAARNDMRIEVRNTSQELIAAAPAVFEDALMNNMLGVEMPLSTQDGRHLGSIKGVSLKRKEPIDIFLILVVLSTLAFAMILFWILGSASPVVDDISKIGQASLFDGKHPPPLLRFEETQRLFDFLKEKALETEELHRFSAVAQTTQMLAHDVRKPFSLLKMFAEAIRASKSIDDFKTLVAQWHPEIDRMVASVEGMLEDIMEIGTPRGPQFEPVSAESIVDVSLGEAFRLFPQSEIVLEYDFLSAHLLHADSLKLNRVILNIVVNALHAMRFRGRIWFKTHDVIENGDLFVQFTIGNSNSFIPQADLARIFDAFYTRNKVGGTGLGLAIAKKIIQGHGGRIWCESLVDSGVEFKMTIPVSEESVRAGQTHLLAHSREFTGLAEHWTGQQAPFVDIAQTGAALETDMFELDEAFKNGIEKLGRKVTVLVVEDEASYRNALKVVLSESGSFAGNVNVMLAATGAEALLLYSTYRPDLVILDIDLGPHSPSGVELVTSLRVMGAKGILCVHSNKVINNDGRLALAAGANLFLPKPMSKVQLVRLLRDAVRCALPTVALKALPGEKNMSVVIVEDCPVTLTAWKIKLRGSRVITSVSPSEFWAELGRGGFSLNELTCVITDYHFENPEEINGLEFATKLKQVFARPIFLSSDTNVSQASSKGIIAAIIGKQPLNAKALMALVEQVTAEGDPLSESASRGSSILT